MKWIISMLVLCLTSLLFAQQGTNQNDLMERTRQLLEMVKVNPERALIESKKIEKEAKRFGLKEAELRAIRIQCEYFQKKYDFENSMIKANELLQKAKNYDLITYQSISRLYLFNAYSYNSISKGIYELESALKLINSNPKEDSLSIDTKANIYVAFSNYYYVNERDHLKRLEYIRLSMDEHEKFSNQSHKEKLRFIDYANLAAAYDEQLYPDSAKYYALLSLSKDKGYNRADVIFTNYLILSQVALKEEKFDDVIKFAKKAEKIQYPVNHVNLELLYQNFIEAYQNMGDKEKALIYSLKKDSLTLTIAQNQNKYLHRIIKDSPESKNNNFVLIILISLLVIIFLLFIFRVKRHSDLKNTDTKLIENDYSEESKEPDFSKLIQLLESNDNAFNKYFDEMFPDFSQKLIRINPRIIQSEIEFCALLKLKIPTKEISIYKNIEPKTVRNKKYRIRKRLDIPKDVDIYHWFEEI